mmetsp:Transcript_11418/g.16755  ORF Transcript_11418/g.16755 Transcript_11418/m.16755 type:complete len:339 (+) Transcript_11418:86-1102(+)|eukprot:CAMPEP_0194218154 /NCGR_PEP_ID=MMETSP0156-20130528/23118_1 /TAXON_ID=33649 /ORGANISM="Thalassionema nitzschioides, Strain L26-B" /LENGTH=338 /DNA_ID=CAMNT_0038947405 /DNA_START=47 /DNA_END=1063 /DNA_ORIENTATION=+
MEEQAATGDEEAVRRSVIQRENDALKQQIEELKRQNEHLQKHHTWNVAAMDESVEESAIPSVGTLDTNEDLLGSDNLQPSSLTSPMVSNNESPNDLQENSFGLNLNEQLPPPLEDNRHRVSLNDLEASMVNVPSTNGKEELIGDASKERQRLELNALEAPGVGIRTNHGEEELTDGKDRKEGGPADGDALALAPATLPPTSLQRQDGRTAPISRPGAFAIRPMGNTQSRHEEDNDEESRPTGNAEDQQASEVLVNAELVDEKEYAEAAPLESPIRALLRQRRVKIAIVVTIFVIIALIVGLTIGFITIEEGEEEGKIKTITYGENGTITETITEGDGG